MSAEPWTPAALKAWRVETVEATEGGGLRIVFARDDGLRVAGFLETSQVLTGVPKHR